VSRGAHPDDPRGLVAEAYRIEGLGVEDARSIFFDWALGLPAGADSRSAAGRLLAHHGAEPAEHPMTRLLLEAETQAETGGRPSRRRDRPI